MDGMGPQNLTDRVFWDRKYSRHRPRYSLRDPIYGRRGLLARTLLPWIGGAKTVIELGCGSSKYLMFFNLMAGLKTHGVDFSREGIRNAALMASRSGVLHTLHLCDLFGDDCALGRYDVVFHSGLAEHFTDLPALFSRCRRFCEDDGLMVFTVPNMRNLAWRWHASLCPENCGAHIPYTLAEISSALSQEFEILHADLWGYPQLYAGGPPETSLARVVRLVSHAVIAATALRPAYPGCSDERWASSLLFVARPRTGGHGE